VTPADLSYGPRFGTLGAADTDAIASGA
jgi:hypothetical protein